MQVNFENINTTANNECIVKHMVLNMSKSTDKSVEIRYRKCAVNKIRLNNPKF